MRHSIDYTRYLCWIFNLIKEAAGRVSRKTKNLPKIECSTGKIIEDIFTNRNFKTRR